MFEQRNESIYIFFGETEQERMNNGNEAIKEGKRRKAMVLIEREYTQKKIFRHSYLIIQLNVM